MTLIGYARVSTPDQSLDPQLDALKQAGCVLVFRDVASGTLATRQGLGQAMEMLEPGHTLVVTKLDRLGRSVRHLVYLSGRIEKQGAALHVVDQGIDTRTAQGRLFFHIVAAIAEFERELIVERTKDGLAAARARGRHGGRRPKLTDMQVDEARRMYDSRRYTIGQIAGAFNCSPRTIYRALETST